MSSKPKLVSFKSRTTKWRERRRYASFHKHNIIPEVVKSAVPNLRRHLSDVPEPVINSVISDRIVNPIVHDLFPKNVTLPAVETKTNIDLQKFKSVLAQWYSANGIQLNQLDALLKFLGQYFQDL